MRNRNHGADFYIYHDPPLDPLYGQSTIPEWIDITASEQTHSLVSVTLFSSLRCSRFGNSKESS